MNNPVFMRTTSTQPVVIRARQPARLKPRTVAVLSFLALHAPMGVALKLVPHLSTIHALSTVAVALILVVRRSPTGLVAAACAYLVGSEALWRMTDAGVFWEFGKYALALVVGAALCFRRLRISSYLPALYLALLLPGALITVVAANTSFGNLRQTLSFDLSGPAAYTVCSLFLLDQRLSQEDILRCLVAILAPIVSIAALTLLGVRTMEVEFGASSSLAASGGFGPNQVAAALALGIVACFLLLTGKGGPWSWKSLLAALAVWFAIQAALTFSRTGLYYSAAAIVFGTGFLVANLRRFALAVILGLVLIGIGWFVIAPQLDAFTGGAIATRFARTDLSGREDLMKGDLLVFIRHPVLGVGVGLSREARKDVVGKSGKSHTEFTRLLSEHGFLGVAALALMLWFGARSLLAQPTGWPRACSASLLVFALIFMTGSGMRMAIPSFLLAFAGIRISPPLRQHLASAGPVRTIVRSAPRPIHLIVCRRPKSFGIPSDRLLVSTEEAPAGLLPEQAGEANRQ